MQNGQYSQSFRIKKKTAFRIPTGSPTYIAFKFEYKKALFLSNGKMHSRKNSRKLNTYGLKVGPLQPLEI